MKLVAILREDLRAVVWEISILLLLYAAYTWQLFHPGANSDGIPSEWTLGAPLSALIIVAWFLILVRTVHQHPLTNKESYWRTRPIPASLLLPAKFSAAFLVCTIPSVLIQFVALLGYSLVPLSTAQLLHALSGHLIVWIMFLLPFLAVGALTRTAASALLTVIGTLLALFLGMLIIQQATGHHSGSHSSGASAWLFWIPLTTTVVMVLLLQYLSRRFYLSWATVGMFVLSMSCLWALMGPFGFPLRLSDRAIVFSSIQAKEDLRIIPLSPLQSVAVADGRTYYALPFSLDKYTNGSVLVPDTGFISLVSPDFRTQILHAPLKNSLFDVIPSNSADPLATLAYLLKDGTAYVVFSVRTSAMSAQLAAPLNLRLWLRGSIHPPPSAEQKHFVTTPSDLAAGVRCQGLAGEIAASHLLCTTAYTAPPNLLATLHSDTSTISFPLRNQDTTKIALNAVTGPEPVLNPLRLHHMLATLDTRMGLPWPPGLHSIANGNASIVPLEPGVPFFAELTLDNVTLPKAPPAEPQSN